MKRYIAALVLALVALPTAASARPPENPPAHLTPLGQSANPALPSHLPAKGTDVAAPDQQASKPGPAAAVELSQSEFDWTDAGLGAAGTALAAFAIAGAVGLRRRRAAPLAG